MSTPHIHREVLSNGLKLLLHETHLAPVVEFQIWAGVGSADERPNEAGLAHFHEHMLFKGTERRGVGDVAGEIEGAGGRINAYTSFDVTVYHATLPSDCLDVGVDVLSDAVLHSAFDPGEIASEIDVVLEEIHRSEDSPGHVLSDAVFATSFQVHPYGKPILGSHESVASIDRDRVRSFYERWYAPDNLTVVAAGDFDATALARQIEAIFGAGAPSGARRSRSAEPVQLGLRTAVLARDFERARVEFAYPAVGLAHSDAPHLDLLAFILGSGDSCRLVRRVKEREELVDRIDASSYTPLDPGFFSLDIETDTSRAADAVAACVREVENLRAEPVGDDELEKARANFLASEFFERESVSGQAHKLGGFELTAGDYRVEETYLAAIRTATPADLQRVANAYLDSERLTLGAVIPTEEKQALDEASLARAVERGRERSARAFAPPRAGTATPPLHHYELDSGARLFVVPRREVPVVAVRAAAFGGLLTEDDETSGLSAFLGGMWLRGTHGRSAADFARTSESLAVEIDSFTGRNSLGLTLECPSDRTERALDLFAEVLLDPSFDGDELERERRDTLAAIERRQDHLAQRAMLLFAETLYREHPYRRSMLGTAESVAGFDRNQVLAHYQKLIRADNLVVAVAGDVDPDDVAQALSTRLADLPTAAFGRPTWVEGLSPDGIRTAEIQKDRSQAHLVIGFPGVSVFDDDRFALEVISQLLAGQGGRLFLELRDRRGLAYSVSSINVEGVAPGYFGVYIATSPERFDDARMGLLEELERLLAEPPDEAELERTRRYLIGNAAIDLQRNAVHAAHVALDGLYGLGPEAYLEFDRMIRGVTPEDVARVSQRIITLGSYVQAAVRP